MPRRDSPSPAADCGRSPEATRERLLDAAEQLFAERGFEGTSMRALAERAGTGVSAGHYHFGGKLELVRAVLLRRIEPINARRLAGLERAVAEAAPDPPALECVLDAFLRPALEAWRGDAAAAPSAARNIIAQLYADPNHRLAELKYELFRPLAERYVEVLASILRDASDEQVRLGFHLVVGVMVHVLGGQLQMLEGERPDGAARMDDETLLGRLVAFSAAGLRAKALAPHPAPDPETPR